MGSVNEEITRIANAKEAIEEAIEFCGIDVPDEDKIDTYSDYIRAIPEAVFSQFNLATVGGDDLYVKSISQTNGVINAQTGGLANSESSGLMSAADKAKLDGIESGSKVNVQSDWNEADTTSDAYILNKPANLSEFNNDLASLNIGTKSYKGLAAVTITKADLGLSSALVYRGIATTLLEDGSTVQRVSIRNSKLPLSPEAGDVVFYNNCEFVWNGSSWEKLGDDVTYKVIQDAVPDPTSDGFGLTFIDTVVQDANGVITATKKTVQSASQDQAGIVTTDDQTFVGAKTFNDGIVVSNTEGISWGNQKIKESTNTLKSLVFYDSTNVSAGYLMIDRSGILPRNASSNTEGVSLGATNYRFSQGYFLGEVSAAGFYETSDARMKNFSTTIKCDLDKLSQLPKKYFTWKSDTTNKLHIGTSAQAVQEIYPELVNEDENGTLSIAYDKLSVVALAAVDKLYEEIKTLQNKNFALEARISNLEKLLVYGKEC